MIILAYASVFRKIVVEIFQNKFVNALFYVITIEIFCFLSHQFNFQSYSFEIML